MISVISDTKHPAKLWVKDLEADAVNQIRNVANMPFIHDHVAVMPDAHYGKGATVGTVIATYGAIIPAAVGVDIGCGMCAIKLPFKIDRLGGDAKLKELRHSIERDIPVAHNGNGEVGARAAATFEALLHLPHTFQGDTYCKAHQQLGSLGGGNHFIEICRDLDDSAWVMLHSGSRNIGKTLADVHIGKAKGLMKQYFISLPDDDLAFLAQGTPEFMDYIHDLRWCQAFAKENRNEMMLRVLKNIAFHVFGEFREPESLTEFRVDCHHNYTNLENHFGRNVWVTRKGAVSAKEGEYGIIPGSMGTRSFIVKGKGNKDSFESCSHGAGRRMSRSQARKQFTVQDIAEQTAGVECRKDLDVVDEIPGSYKDIQQVMENQADLVDPVYELKQILCVKG